MKKKKISPEEQKRILKESRMRDIKRQDIPKNPTRTFVVDERVHFGAHNEVYVREILEDGLFYEIECLNVQRDRDKPPANETHYIAWTELLKYNQTKPTTFRKEEKYRIVQSNSSISSLINMVYGHAGVDFDVEYQREHVWDINDKIALIDSIYNNVDIGKFVFAQRDFGHKGKLYEVIDGKQRLTALCEFYEDRFKYKGYYYSELSHNDKHKFKEHSISYGYLINPNKKAIFETFIKLNTCGRPMVNKDIDKVKKLLSEL